MKKSAMSEEPDLFTRAHTHRQPMVGEQLAARKARHQSASMRAAIQEQLRVRDYVGMTPDEFSALTHGLINTVRRRFTDLWKAGIIQHHPAKLHRPNAAGNLCVVWVLGRDPAMRLSRFAQLQLQVTELQEENRRLRDLLKKVNQ